MNSKRRGELLQILMYGCSYIQEMLKMERIIMTTICVKQGKNKGFTLIELSIVLVIIGLIVGGILVGQDLIRAAEIRATVSQKEKFDVATNTFRGKYNGLPGDLSNYTNFSGQLTVTGLTGANGFGDGDGQIEGIGGSGTDNVGLVGEIKLYWKHLADSGLIGDDISVTTTAAGADITTAVGSMPSGKLGKGSFWHVGAAGGLNYFVLAGVTDAAAATSFVVTSSDVITPNEAFQIDTKLDDGKPETGVVRSTAAITSMATAPAGGAASGDCYDTDTDLYATADATENLALTCVLRMRTSF